MARPGTVVVLYHRPSHLFFKDAATVREHIHAFKRYSRFAVWEVNTDLGFPPGLDDVEPGAVVLHYSLFGSGIYQLGDRFLNWLRRHDGTLKVAFFQDEFHLCRQRFAFVNDVGVDLVFTHVSPADIPRVWGRYTPGVRAIFNLPGYVDEGLLAAARRFARPDAERDVDVSYRGRPLPPYMGAGSQEKRVIGERFKQLAAGTSLRLDIETSEDSRLYGDAWYRLLGRSRVTLGVESGVSFMDLEDECNAEYVRLREEGRDPTLEELLAGALGRWDGNIPYRTLGPRHFEAAAFRICQVLFEGEYSGAIEPMVHYVPLKKDFSNFAEVVAVIKDAEQRRRITDSAYEELIASGRFGYASLIESVDRELVAARLSLEVSRRERDEIGRALRRRHVRRSVRRRSAVTLELTMAKLRHSIWRVVAPVSVRVRRVLGLRVPS